MTARQRTLVQYGSLLLTLLGGVAWSYNRLRDVDAKESKADHTADMQRVDAKLDRLLDLACQDKPTARQCVP